MNVFGVCVVFFALLFFFLDILAVVTAVAYTAVAVGGFRFNLFAINSKRIFPWLFCL